MEYQFCCISHNFGTMVSSWIKWKIRRKKEGLTLQFSGPVVASGVVVKKDRRKIDK